MPEKMMFKVVNMDGRLIARFIAKGDAYTFAFAKVETYRQVDPEVDIRVSYNNSTKTITLIEEGK